ncbi:hypothetical protein BRD01_02990 [Halobacteriales archaeon QS_8_65_32]|jgi:hypothetical protein|nr:MAG: hypothetical protein BRD01_02990 [Halobacteriales archaeon QS_8_65_32]
MNITTALLNRLVPGRGDEDETAPTESEHASANGSGSAGHGEDEHAAGSADVGSSRIADEDVSEEALVLRKLIAHGGRVHRSTLAEETEWPEDDLDDVLREMEADGQISTIRRRDPLVCRRGFEPAGAPLRFAND